MTTPDEQIDLAIQLFDLMGRDCLRHAEEFENHESLAKADAYFGAKHMLEEITGRKNRGDYTRQQVHRLQKLQELGLIRK